jgi:hypothetical protein
VVRRPARARTRRVAAFSFRSPPTVARCPPQSESVCGDVRRLTCFVELLDFPPPSSYGHGMAAMSSLEIECWLERRLAPARARNRPLCGRPAVRPAVRPPGRPAVRPPGRGEVREKRRFFRCQRRLRASRFPEVSTSPTGRDADPSSLPSRRPPIAQGATAIAQALTTQRLSGCGRAPAMAARARRRRS